jgi:probable rRNA maturation factor
MWRRPATVQIVVDDAQRDRPIDADRWSALARAVLGAEGIAGNAELSIRFVDEPEIAELNAEHLGHVGPTDVLSFPIEDDPHRPAGSSGAPVLLGDIIICPEVAFRNAPDHAGTYDAELALLIVHGILHLLGFDHESDDEATEMEGREAALLAAYFAPSGTT